MKRIRQFALASISCLVWCGPALGLDHVAFQRDGKSIRVDGRLLVTAQDGGIAVQGRDGIIWMVQPEELVEHTADAAAFEPFPATELVRQLLAELPAGFDVHSTANYLIFYDTSRAYAEWCGSLFERLYMAFTNFWRRKGFQLSEPEFPLVAVVFADKPAYVAFSRSEAGEAAESIIGYYSLRTNRMVTYDLTGAESYNRHSRRRITAAQINRILSRPDALRTVATIVHEATHQIAYNCGLHARYSDCPRWVSEGIALYFETPDLASAKGWRNIEAVNRVRLARFQSYLRGRPADSLVTLLSDDRRFRDTGQGPDAYAEAWALTYLLIRQSPKQYVEYLKLLSQKKPFIWDDPETRLGEFKQVFGEDLEALDRELVRYMLRAR